MCFVKEVFVGLGSVRWREQRAPPLARQHACDGYANAAFQRWGDAPVHSLAVALFLNTSQVHFFDPIGYQHDDWSHCPLNRDLWEQGECDCRWRGEFGEYM